MRHLLQPPIPKPAALTIAMFCVALLASACGGSGAAAIDTTSTTPTAEEAVSESPPVDATTPSDEAAAPVDTPIPEDVEGVQDTSEDITTEDSGDAPDDASASADAAGVPPQGLLDFENCLLRNADRAVEFEFNDEGTVIGVVIEGSPDDLGPAVDECGPLLAGYESVTEFTDDLVGPDEIPPIPAVASTCTDDMADYGVCTLVPNLGGGLDGIVVSDDGTIYVVAPGGVGPPTRDALYAVTESGEISLVHDNLVDPYELTRGPDGSVLTHRGPELVQIAPDGSETILATVDGGAGQLIPIGVGPDGATYFTVDTPESNGLRIDRIGEDGERTLYVEIPKPGSLPGGWTPAARFDSNGNLILADSDTVFQITPEAEVIELVQIPGAAGDYSELESAGFGGIEVANDTIYLPSFNAAAVYVVQLDGSFEVLAGGAPRPSADGIGAEASFNSPSRVAFDPIKNRLYVTDYLDSSIRAIQLPAANDS